MKEYFKALTVAGSDCSGGAGIQADLKTFSACECYGMSVITALTAQNTIGVNDIEIASTTIIQKQFEAIADDIGIDAMKTGMLPSADIVDLITFLINKYNIDNVVVDPVMVSTSGHKLMQDEAIEVLKLKLLPVARVITPNIPEANILLNGLMKCEDNMEIAVKELANRYSTSVLLKAGHIEEEQLIDFFYNVETTELLRLKSKKILTKNLHGTGCTLSAAITSFLAKEKSLTDSVFFAKEFITEAILKGDEYKIGNGNGPVKHFFKYWDK